MDDGTLRALVIVDHPVILTTAQTAQLLVMSTQEVTRGAREGWLPAHRLDRQRAWEFNRDEVLNGCGRIRR